ncbi:MAG: hypothetical protein NZS48_00185 [Gemmata sp.]|nr:hypothetical protein [Gemmata sp.]
MSEYQIIDSLGPTTKSMILASGHETQLAELFSYYRKRIGDREFQIVIQHVEEVLDAARRGIALVCYTYDDEMVIPNIISNIVGYCNYTIVESDTEETYQCGQTKIILRNTDIDDNGKSCSSILVNQ